MEFTLWVSYVAMISALIAFPGPSSLLITMHGYQYGFKKSNYTIFANLLGSLILMVLSALGLGALIFTSEVLFTIIKYLGAAYLIFLGIKTFFQSAKNKKNNDEQQISTQSSSSLFKQGFFTGISNPKDLLFFAALFPVFINTEQAILGQFLILMVTWLVIDYLIKIVYSLAGKKIHQKFSSPSFMTVFNRITGGLFISAGLVLAGSNQK